jgi:hypothetical protein
VRLAARVVPGALPRTEIGCELSGPDWYAGAMRPQGPSLLPVRPLRLSPITATAGGRARVTPVTGPNQLAAVTPTGRCPRRTPRQPSGPRHEAAKVDSGAVGRTVPIPGAAHCLSRPEPVKGA